MWPFIKPLLSLDFWFHTSALPFVAWAGVLLLSVFGAFILIGAAIWFWMRRASKLEKERRTVIRQLSILLFWSGISGLLLYWFNWQEIPLLSMRIWYIALFAILIACAVVFILRWVKTIPMLDKARAEREAYEKWLPKPKKH